MKRLIAGVIICGLGLAQNANIYTFSDAEAREGARLYEAMHSAELAYDKWAYARALEARGVGPEAEDDGRRLNFAADFKTGVWDTSKAMPNVCSATPYSGPILQGNGNLSMPNNGNLNTLVCTTGGKCYCLTSTGAATVCP